jgi:hypothetical protein
MHGGGLNPEGTDGCAQLRDITMSSMSFML